MSARFNLSAEIVLQKEIKNFSAIRRQLNSLSPQRITVSIDTRSATSQLNKVRRELTELQRLARSIGTIRVGASGGRVNVINAQKAAINAKRQFDRHFQPYRATLVVDTTQALRSLGVVRTRLTQIQALAGNIRLRGLNNRNSLSGAGLQQTTRGLRQATAASNNFGTSVVRAASRYSAFLLGISGTVGVINEFREGIAEAAAFEKQIIKTAQVANISVDAAKKLGREILDVGVKFGVSSQDLAAFQTDLLSANFSIEETQKLLEAGAKTQLGASFGDLSEVANASIILKNFAADSNEIVDILSRINSVSNAYAVESQTFTSALARSGAAAKNAGLDINELLGIITAIKQTSRLSDSTIGVSIKSILSKLQSPDSISKLSALGVNSIGADGGQNSLFDILRQLNAAQQNFSKTAAGKLQFNQGISDLVGIHQTNALQAAISGFPLAEQSKQVAAQGGDSLTTDAAKAQTGLQNQLEQTRQAFLKLYSSISNDKTLHEAAETALLVAKAFAEIAESSKIIPRLATGGFQIGKSVTQFFTGQSVEIPDFIKELVTGRTNKSRLSPKEKVQQDATNSAKTGSTPIPVAPPKFTAISAPAQQLSFAEQIRSIKNSARNPLVDFRSPQAQLITGLEDVGSDRFLKGIQQLGLGRQETNQLAQINRTSNALPSILRNRQFTPDNFLDEVISDLQKANVGSAVTETISQQLSEISFDEFTRSLRDVDGFSKKLLSSFNSTTDGAKNLASALNEIRQREIADLGKTFAALSTARTSQLNASLASIEVADLIARQQKRVGNTNLGEAAILSAAGGNATQLGSVLADVVEQFKQTRDARLGLVANDLASKLQLLTNTVERNRNIQEKLNQIEERRAGKLSYLQNYFGSDREGRRELQESQLTVAKARGLGLNALSMKEQRQTVNALSGPLSGLRFDGQSGEELLRSLLEQSNPRMFEGLNRQQTRLEGIQLERTRDAATAQQAIASLDMTSFQMLADQLPQSSRSFLALAESLNGLNLPESIALAGEVQVNVTFQNAEGLAALQGEIRSMVDRKINERLAAVIPIDGPSGRRLN